MTVRQANLWSLERLWHNLVIYVRGVYPSGGFLKKEGKEMATAVIIILLIVIVIFSVKSYMKKLASGCCGAGGDSVKRIKPADGDINNYPCLKRVKIGGMTCKNCALRVENAFNGREGYMAKVNLSKKEADIYMKNPADNSILEDIVKRAGYEVLSVETIK